MNGTLILEDYYWQVYVSNNPKTMVVKWLNQQDLQEADLRLYLEKWAELVEEHRPGTFMVDSRLGHSVMTVEMQSWHDEVIVPRYVQAGVRKIAVVIPDDFFAMLSLELTFAESAAKDALETQFFDTSEKASVWLYGKPRSPID